MKVYYKILNVHNPKADMMMAAIADAFPGQIRGPLEDFFKSHKNITEQYVIEKFEKVKYKIMWALRGIEKEINEEGGMIIITPEFRIETKDFSEELTERISGLLDSNY